MPDEDFKLPGSSYDLLSQIIAAYGEFDRPVSTTEVSDLIDSHRTQVSRNNGFLVAVGVVDSGKLKTPTEEGRELARAIQWEREPEIQRSWRTLLKGNEFVDKILTAVKVRKGMERSTLESHIAYTAGQKRTERVMTGASTVVEILLIAGFLEEQEGKLVVAGQQPEVITDPEEPRLRAPTPRASVRQGDLVARRVDSKTGIVIQVQIQCKPSDLEALSGQLRKFFEDMSAPGDESPAHET